MIKRLGAAFCFVLSVLVLFSCDVFMLSETTGGGDKDKPTYNGNGTGVKLSLNSSVGYNNFIKFDETGTKVSDSAKSSADTALNDTVGGLLHLLVELNTSSVKDIEIYKGNGFVFKIQSSVNGSNNIVKVGKWARNLDDEFGFSSGQVNDSGDKVNVTWGYTHYTQAVIDKMKDDAAALQEADRGNEAWDLSQTYYSYNAEIEQLSALMDCESFGAILEILTSNVITKNHFDLSSYAFNSSTGKYASGSNAAIFDSEGNLRVLETNGVKVYFDYDATSDSLMAPPLPQNNTSGDKEYTKSQVSSEQFKLWNDAPMVDYSTMDSWYGNTKGASNLSVTLNSKDAAGNSILTKYYKITTQNESGTNGGTTNSSNSAFFSKICQLIYKNGKLKTGEARMARTNDDSSGDRTGNIKTEYERAAFEIDDNESSSLTENSSHDDWMQLWNQRDYGGGAYYEGDHYTAKAINRFCGLWNGKCTFNVTGDLIKIPEWNDDYLLNIDKYTFNFGYYETQYEGVIWQCPFDNFCESTKEGFIQHMDDYHHKYTKDGVKSTMDLLDKYHLTAEQWVAFEYYNSPSDWEPKTYDVSSYFTVEEAGGQYWYDQLKSYKPTFIIAPNKAHYKLAFDQQGRLREVDFYEFERENINATHKKCTDTISEISRQNVKFDYGLEIPTYFPTDAGNTPLQ